MSLNIPGCTAAFLLTSEGPKLGQVILQLYNLESSIVSYIKGCMYVLSNSEWLKPKSRSHVLPV